jgi:hypothetical protein
MDRNLYERANDCRWWAITPLFEEELVNEKPDTQHIMEVLRYINSLYTVYTNLFIYDKTGNLIASSNDLSIIGQKISGEYITKTLGNTNSQNYFVSPFEKTALYSNQATYIYSATVRSAGKTLGGIGIVFDAYPQFQAMLNESFPPGKNGFSCFIDRKGMIISTTHPTLQPTDTLELNDEILRFNGTQPEHRFIILSGKKYLLGIALSQGYREYKCEDNYKNDILSLTFIEY